MRLHLSGAGAGGRAGHRAAWLLAGRGSAEGVSPPVGEASRVMLNVQVPSSLTSQTAFPLWICPWIPLTAPQSAPDGLQSLLLLDAAELGSGQSRCHPSPRSWCALGAATSPQNPPAATLGCWSCVGSSPWSHSAEQGEEREIHPSGRNVSPSPNIPASWCSIKTPSRAVCTCVPCHSPAHPPVLLGWHGTDSPKARGVGLGISTLLPKISHALCPSAAFPQGMQNP